MKDSIAQPPHSLTTAVCMCFYKRGKAHIQSHLYVQIESRFHLFLLRVFPLLHPRIYTHIHVYKYIFFDVNLDAL